MGLIRPRVFRIAEAGICSLEIQDDFPGSFTREVQLLRWNDVGRLTEMPLYSLPYVV